MTGFHVDTIVESRHIQHFCAFAVPLYLAPLLPMSMPMASTTRAVNNLTNTNGNANKQLYHQTFDSPARSTMTATTATNSNGNSARDESTIVGLHYKIGKKIGEGSFGVLFEGTNMINGVPVAIKFEPRKTEAPQLRDEYKTCLLYTSRCV